MILCQWAILMMDWGWCLCSGRFEDARSALTCPICNMTFSASEPAELVYNHVVDHVAKVCPICTQEFQPDDVTFESHVNMCIMSVTSNEPQEQQQQQQQQEQQPQEQQQQPQLELSPTGEFAGEFVWNCELPADANKHSPICSLEYVSSADITALNWWTICR